MRWEERTEPLGVLRCYVCGEPVISHDSWIEPCPALGSEERGWGDERSNYRTPHPADSEVMREAYRRRRR